MLLPHKAVVLFLTGEKKKAREKQEQQTRGRGRKCVLHQQQHPLNLPFHVLFYLFPTSELHFYFISCNRTRPRHSAGRMEGSILETCVLGRLLCGVRWALAGICPSSENVWCGGCKGAGDSGSPHLFPLVAVELFASLLSLFLLLFFSLLSYFLSLSACRAGFKSCGFVWVSWVPPLPIGFYFVSVWRTPTGRFCAILKDSRKARHAGADFASRRNYHAKGIYVSFKVKHFPTSHKLKQMPL